MKQARAWIPQLMAMLLGCSGAPRDGQASQVPDEHAAEPPMAAAAPASGEPQPAAKAPEPEPTAQPALPGAAASTSAAVAEALAYDPADPLADLEKADALDRGAGRAPRAAVEVPAR